MARSLHNRFEGAFDRALQPLYRPLCRYAARRVGTQDAEDVVQEALLAAWNARDDRDVIPPPSEFLAWLRRFVDYACASYLRRRFLHPVETLTEAQEQTIEQRPAPPPLTELLLRYRQELYRLLQTVPLTQRQHFCLSAWLNGQSQFQIAATLRVDPKTVWEHLDAATRKLSRAAKTEQIAILEVYYAEVHRPIYQAPETVGARLAREKLAAYTPHSSPKASRSTAKAKPSSSAKRQDSVQQTKNIPSKRASRR
ncbi:RNA polymerase sigma factor, sigma-70 family [Chthonomonas calidirosea]|uniref:RNA polymerase sigma factor n=1 Tax=Chthonomonas calidirosea TaxID=454171 RepID=UPI0006DD4F76|nr:RNA polymerase sigma factor [Chthonomonas calidirosea]CEK19827.1 RNA polymerase sigma factor, sigma-70 family [Chthonomonas calidirosea]